MTRIRVFTIQNRAVILRTGVVFALAGLVYGMMAGRYLMEQSIAPHYVYLAQAFLHRQTNLIEPVISSYDLLRYEGKLYVAHQPLPALLLLPIVYFVTPINVPDVLFTVVVGAASVALCDLTLGAAVPGLSNVRRGLLTLFFALGTVHAYLSALGTVWFTAQVCAALFMWVFLLGTVWRLPWLSGIGLGMALLGRVSPVPGALLLYAGWWFIETGQYDLMPRIRFLIKPVILFSVPFLLCAGFLGWYNAARFGSPLDFGYDYIIDENAISERRAEHGTFSPVFLPDNLYTATIRAPLWKNGKPEPDPWGMGLLLTSPVLLYAFLPFVRTRKRDSETIPAPDENHKMTRQKQILLAVSIFVMLFPALLYHNTGSVQFGYRFALDALPVWMILTAIGARRGSTWLLVGLVLVSIAVNVWGFAWMYDLINSQPRF